MRATCPSSKISKSGTKIREWVGSNFQHSGGNVNKDHNVSVCVSGTAGAAFNLNFRGSVFQGAPADEQVNR